MREFVEHLGPNVGVVPLVWSEMVCLPAVIALVSCGLRVSLWEVGKTFLDNVYHCFSNEHICYFMICFELLENTSAGVTESYSSESSGCCLLKDQHSEQVSLWRIALTDNQPIHSEYDSKRAKYAVVVIQYWLDQVVLLRTGVQVLSFKMFLSFFIFRALKYLRVVIFAISL